MFRPCHLVWVGGIVIGALVTATQWYCRPMVMLGAAVYDQLEEALPDLEALWERWDAQP